MKHDPTSLVSPKMADLINRAALYELPAEEWRDRLDDWIKEKYAYLTVIQPMLLLANKRGKF